MIETIKNSFLKPLFNRFDEKVKNTPHWKLVGWTTFLVSCTVFLLYRKMQSKSWNLNERIKFLIKLHPSLNKKLTEEFEKFKKNLHSELSKTSKPEEIVTILPEKGMNHKKILERLKNASGSMSEGKNTGACYDNDPELNKLQHKAKKYGKDANELHPTLNPLIRQLEAEIVRMTINLFHGDDKCVGDITSGGTDSILHAVLTARRRATSLGLGSGFEMIAPETAHSAFAKAAEMFGIKLIRVKVYPQNHFKAYQVNPKAIEKAITDKTILVVASCPGFPHGVVDPIEDISNMLIKKDPKKKIGLHVDACLGGFIAIWMKKTSFKDNIKTKFGFDVERVTTISADTHKYGYGKKGTSVLMHKDFIDWRKHQIFVDPHWCGGMYATPRFPGSSPGDRICALWANYMHHGQEGFIKKAEAILQTASDLTEEIQEQTLFKEHLQLMGKPEMMVVAFCAKKPEQINIYDVHSEMKKRGWYLSALQNPPGIHFCVTNIHAKNSSFVEGFSKDLNESVQAVLNYRPEQRGKTGEGPMYCSNQRFGENMFMTDFVKEYYNIISETGPFENSNQDLKN